MARRDAVRVFVLVEGHTQREAARHFHMSRNTVAKLLGEPAEGTERRYQRRQVRPAPVSEGVLPHIRQWLDENEWLQRWKPKQQWTARRMWLELQRQSIPAGESTVRQLVRRERQQRQQERRAAYVPLAFGPGERAEFDFGEVAIETPGQLRTLPFLVGRLRFSGAMFLEVFPTQRQEAFLLGQQHAFEFWGGVPRSAVYDNLKAAVARILEGHVRSEHERFLHFRSVYRFEALFANVRSGWEKGSVENLVGYARRTYLVPIPQVERLEALSALNAVLRERCLDDQQRTLAGQTASIAERLAVERAYLGPLPAQAPEVGVVRDVVVRSTGQVRFEANVYSVPIQYAYHRLVLKADPFQVRLYAGDTLVATHQRSYAKGEVIEDWRHYVRVLLEKPFALPFASAVRQALQQGDLPAEWEQFRQDLVARRRDGNREFARILELATTHPLAEVDAAVHVAAEHPDWTADTVRQLLGWRMDPAAQAAPLDAVRYPAYQLTLPTPDMERYNRLLEVEVHS
ncbi:MAG: IS21 family transposase [Ktedonobacterales bacterium]